MNKEKMQTQVKSRRTSKFAIKLTNQLKILKNINQRRILKLNFNLNGGKMQGQYYKLNNFDSCIYTLLIKLSFKIS